MLNWAGASLSDASETAEITATNSRDLRKMGLLSHGGGNGDKLPLSMEGTRRGAGGADLSALNVPDSGPRDSPRARQRKP